MNRFLFLFITLGWSSLLFLGYTGNNTETYIPALPISDTTEVVTVPIDTARSVVKWKGTEMWQTGEHEGTVRLKKGNLSLNKGQIVGGKFITDMNSIAIIDIPKHEPVPRRNLRNHLKSEDFFYVEKHPTAEFKITKIEPRKADSVKVWGELSIRDVTKSISFIASRESGQNSTLVLNAAFKIDRFEYNVSYQGSYWDRITSILDNTLVDADIFLSVQLVTVSMEQNS